MGRFDDLIPQDARPAPKPVGRFDDLIPGTAKQEYGDIPAPSEFKRFLPSREELPEIAMSLPSKVSPLIGGTLAAGGEAVRQIGERFVGAPTFRTKPPETSQDAAKRLFYAALRGAAANIAGKGIEKAFSPFAGAATGNATRKITESAGIKPPLGTLTESKSVQIMERGLEATPFGFAITKQRQKALSDFTNFTKGIGERLAVKRPAEVTGNLVKEELANLPARFGEATDAMYDSVLPLIKEANPSVELKNTIAKLDDIIENRSGEFEQVGLKELRTLKEKLSKLVVDPNLAIFEKGKGASKAFEGLKKDRTNLGLKLKNKFGDPSVGGLEKDLKGLYGAMTEDMNLTVKKVSEKAFNDLQSASAAFSDGQQIIKSSLFKDISKAKPENVYKFVIVPRAPQNVEMGREILVDTFNDVARQWFDDIVKQSQDATTGLISHVKLSNKLKQYEEVLPAIAEGNPVLLEQFTNLKKISNLLAKGKDVSSGSITAFAGAGMSSIGAIIAAAAQAFTNPALAAKIAAGVGVTGLGVKGITSDIGREFLTRGFPKAGRIARRIVVPSVELGLQKLTNQRSLRDIINEE